MKKVFVLIFATVSFGFFNCKETSASKNFENISPEQFNSFISGNSVQLIDVRTSNEFNSGHIPNAMNIDFFSDEFVNNINKLDKEAPVFIYCRSGKRSGKSVIDFQKAGFKKIYNLEGGFLKWKSVGY
ncbi:rhodanese-like domain-containing protein [Flaviramulus sp. BrNp1-15]|uniref:rhodanese-like domain-containing protein n=1 Tax=Flaviramulus sp. BrNp1-15 TaxID=2916754 RepID=UPI001EE7C2A2|nr:rhodanese-like domain-containing protein [Flaviramulus sp. BrNp1-15]ULC59070.1 rhodanese-like domain-containing protein [Flaviramulus sp. BrNp1-15]